MVNFRDSYFQVDWDLSKKHLRGTFWGKQYDTGRGFSVTVINGGQVVTPSNEVLRLKWEKPDNTTGYVNATTINGKFVIESIDQMFTVQGSVRADFELSVAGETLASITFYVTVEKAVAVDAIESSSQFTALQEALADVGDMQAQVDAVIANATVDSEVILARGTEPTLGARLDASEAQLAEIVNKASFNKISVLTPTDFTWKSHPLASKIMKNIDGTFSVDFDISDLQHIGAGKTYYVNVSTGNDSNNGLTPETALASIAAAVNKSDVDIIMVAGGTYNRTMGFNNQSIPSVNISKNLTIKAMEGQRPVISVHDDLIWSLVAGKTKTYQASKSIIIDVVDMSVLDGYGDHTQLVKRNSIDEVEANAGSYYYTGSILYVHTVDSRPADSNIRAYLDRANMLVSGNINLYVEGITFEGGGQSGGVKIDDSLGVPNFYAKDCTFSHTESMWDVSRVNTFRYEAGGNCFMQNCLAKRAGRDGFSYDKLAKVIEIDCIGRNNGLKDTNNTNNGSTAHTGCKVIRVNGIYCYNKGGNIADVGYNTETWCIGCESFETKANPVTDQFGNYYVNTDNAKMFLDSCVSYGSARGVNVLAATNSLYLRNFRNEGTIEGAGQKIYY